MYDAETMSFSMSEMRMNNILFGLEAEPHYIGNRNDYSSKTDPIATTCIRTPIRFSENERKHMEIKV